jgi:hypothetical protein
MPFLVSERGCFSVWFYASHFLGEVRTPTWTRMAPSLSRHFSECHQPRPARAPQVPTLDATGTVTTSWTTWCDGSKKALPEHPHCKSLPFIRDDAIWKVLLKFSRADAAVIVTWYNTGSAVSGRSDLDAGQLATYQVSHRSKPAFMSIKNPAFRSSGLLISRAGLVMS